MKPIAPCMTKTTHQQNKAVRRRARDKQNWLRPSKLRQTHTPVPNEDAEQRRRERGIALGESYFTNFTASATMATSSIVFVHIVRHVCVGRVSGRLSMWA